MFTSFVRLLWKKQLQVLIRIFGRLIAEALVNSELSPSVYIVDNSQLSLHYYEVESVNAYAVLQ